METRPKYNAKTSSGDRIVVNNVHTVVIILLNY